MASPAVVELLRSQLPGDGIMLRVHSRRGWRWSGSAAREALRTSAYIKLQPVDQGTHVHVTLRSQYFVATFITVWIALVALFGAVTVAITVIASAQPYGLVIALFLLGLGISFIPLGRFLGRSERTALLDFTRMVVSTP